VPATPDSAPGALQEDIEIRFTTDDGASPSVAGALTYDPATGLFLARDPDATFDLLYGAQRFHAEDLGVSTTTSQTPQTKVSISQSIPAGRYAIGWSLDLSVTAANRQVAADVFADGLLRKESILRPTAANIPTTFGGVLEIALAAGTRSFQLRYRAAQAGTTASAERASLSVWRTA
jgi:hypothetical protein